MIQIANSKVFCKLGNGTIRDLTLDTNTVYTHPSTIQCNASTEINNLKTSVSNGKTLIANAITGKGVATSSSDTFATMASKISQIKSVTTTAAYDTGTVEYSGKESTSFPSSDDWHTFSYYADGKYSGTNATKKDRRFNTGAYTVLYIYTYYDSTQSYYRNNSTMYTYTVSCNLDDSVILYAYLDDNYDWHCGRASTNAYINADNNGYVSIDQNGFSTNLPGYPYTPMSSLKYRVAYWVI